MANQIAMLSILDCIQQAFGHGEQALHGKSHEVFLNFLRLAFGMHVSSDSLLRDTGVTIIDYSTIRVLQVGIWHH